MTKPNMARLDGTDDERGLNLIRSALRTLEAESEGIGALAASIRDGLGLPFVKAVDLIRDARGRVIVTGMGKSGHVGTQDRRHARLHRHAGASSSTRARRATATSA